MPSRLEEKSYREWTGSEWCDHAEDALVMEYTHHEEVEAYLVELFIEAHEIPETIWFYLDEDLIVRDLCITDFFNDTQNRVLWRNI